LRMRPRAGTEISCECRRIAASAVCPPPATVMAREVRLATPLRVRAKNPPPRKRRGFAFNGDQAPWRRRLALRSARSACATRMRSNAAWRPSHAGPIESDLQRVAGWIEVPDRDLNPFATARANGSLALGQLLQRGLRTSPQQHPEQGQAH
jgi:hypothetical protein